MNYVLFFELFPTKVNHLTENVVQELVLKIAVWLHLWPYKYLETCIWKSKPSNCKVQYYAVFTIPYICGVRETGLCLLCELSHGNLHSGKWIVCLLRTSSEVWRKQRGRTNRNGVIKVLLDVMHLMGWNYNNRAPLLWRWGLAIINQSASPEVLPPCNCGAFHCITPIKGDVHLNSGHLSLIYWSLFSL